LTIKIDLEKIQITINLEILKDKTILFLGRTGSGKSTLINDILNENAKIGHGAKSCTDEIKIYDKNNVKCIDTPGLNDSENRDQEFLNKLYNDLKLIKYDIVCFVTSEGRRNSKDFQEITNLYLQMLNIDNQKIFFVFTSADVTNDEFMYECIKELCIDKKYNFSPIRYNHNTTPNIQKIINCMAKCCDKFDSSKIRKIETNEELFKQAKKEKEELEKANFLVQQEYNKIKKNEKGEEVESLKQKLIDQSKELEIRKNMIGNNNYFVQSGQCQEITKTTKKTM